MQRIKTAPFGMFALLLFIFGLVGLIVAVAVPSVTLQFEVDTGSSKETYVYNYDARLEMSTCDGDNCDDIKYYDDFDNDGLQEAVNGIIASYIMMMVTGLIFLFLAILGMLNRYGGKVMQYSSFMCFFFGILVTLGAISASMTLNSIGLGEIHSSANTTALGYDDTATIMTPMGIANTIIGFILLLFLFLHLRKFWRTLPPAPQYIVQGAPPQTAPVYGQAPPPVPGQAPPPPGPAPPPQYPYGPPQAPPQQGGWQ